MGALPGPARADLELAKNTPELKLTEGLAIAEVSSWGRRAVNLDAVADAMARGTLGTPTEGATLARPSGLGNGDRAWKTVKAGENGEFAGLGRGAYVLCTVTADAERVMMLEASGDSMVYVNGEPHAGDPYSNGKLHIPIVLKPGANQLLFAHAGRGGLRAKLGAPARDVFVCTDDLTLPDVLSDEPEEYWIGAPIVNATTRARTLIVRVRPNGPEGFSAGREERIELPALSVQKAALRIRASRGKDRADAGGTILIADADGKGAEPVGTPITLRARSADEVHLRTFVSAIDGSVQYVAITPQAKEGRVDRPGLVLSLHGASVEASGQAPCYAPKPDFVVVCPTNRRPYGFDWEDWGRADAIEAMDHAKAWFRTDPRKQYLTGHSMGGHGAWQLGVLLSDRFAAVGPSAGWLSFDTYANRREEPTETAETQLRVMFRRAGSSSDTLALMPNLRGTGVYILHGDADDNVPVTEARRAREELTKLDVPFEYHEQPGAGHWWDAEGPGTACVDWAPMFEMFRSRTLPRPGEAREFHVRGLEAGVALPPGDGVRILRAEHGGRMATADVLADRASGTITITTDNAAELALGELVCGDAPHCALEIDGRPIKAARRGSHVTLEKLADGRWADAGENPARSASSGELPPAPIGPFKNALTNRFVLVYATRGTAQENAWSLARARYDAEQWWYRGNGRGVMMSDERFLKGMDGGEPIGNAILYGNTTTNSAAARLCAGQAVRVERDAAGIGDRRIAGDFGVMAIGTYTAGADRTPRLYALVGGTGLTGMRTTDRMPYLQSGVGIPDVCVLRSDVWSKGTQGIECAGFLGARLGMVGSELVWRDAAAAK
jgi:poly(3-hydroxybutyrate) depolymerase